MRPPRGILPWGPVTLQQYSFRSNRLPSSRMPALDVLVVALLTERSFAMFASPSGTWLPLALIVAATWITGRGMTM